MVPGHSDETGHMELSLEQREAIREAIHRFAAAEPERDDGGHEFYLIEVQSAVRMYAVPPSDAPAPRESEQRTEHSPHAFEAVAARADELTATLEGLDAYTRGRLVETTSLDAAALENLERLTRLAASQAKTVARQITGEELPIPVPSKSPEIELVERLLIIWTRHTERQVVRDREAASPWARFVEVACSVAGIHPETAHRVRLRVYDTSSLGESVEILATIPDL